MRSIHWCALAAGMMVLAAGLVKWHSSRQRAPARSHEQTARETPETAPRAPDRSQPPALPTPAPRPFEPIAVVAQPFTDPPPPLPSVLEVAGAEESAAFEPRPNPRPDPSVLRMPYADEELSEFAILLQRAAEQRRQAAAPLPVLGNPVPGSPVFGPVFGRPVPAVESRAPGTPRD